MEYSTDHREYGKGERNRFTIFSWHRSWKAPNEMSQCKTAGLRQRKGRALSWQHIIKWQGGTHPAAEFGPLADCAEALRDHKDKGTK